MGTSEVKHLDIPHYEHGHWSTGDDRLCSVLSHALVDDQVDLSELGMRMVTTLGQPDVFWLALWSSAEASPQYRKYLRPYVLEVGSPGFYKLVTIETFHDALDLVARWSPLTGH